ncbi:ABC transporter ATP-binding protein [Glycomyces tritici]|uniref:ABC transporter ATP-binding protein n=1 Tax=Glycomyces tritici TaxID=2665176 RepID=A0ABT7YT99_9ACTN|nr:ABC transporter ATP-binding protein [Glycomyces tritici]MDN3241873.1 ABC transporter ATP-binding protein [Glycomyces tritici]
MNAAADPGGQAAGLDAHLVVDRGGFRLDLRLHVAPGETVALLGPNGAGKTTALRALAGLEQLSDGHIALNGEVLDRPGSQPGRMRAARSGSQIDGPPNDNPDTGVRQPFSDAFEQGRADGVAGGRRGDRWVPPEERRIGVVFQDYLLFPHLTAADNIAFGPRRRGLGRAESRAIAAEWLERVGLQEFGKRRPKQLSGGQAQRVALARALASEPALLLLDEPLAALDARTRLDTRAELHRHLTGHTGPAIVVTHDPVDALMLADRLVVVEDGRAVQEGDAESVTARPRTDYIARLVGLNLYRGVAEGNQVVLDGGLSVAAAAGPGRGDDGSGPATAVAAGPAEGPMVLVAADPLSGPAFAAFPPSAVALYPERPEGSPRNTWRATVSGVHRHGDNVRVQLDGPLKAAADVTPAAAAQLRLEPGRGVWATVKASEIRTYPA